MYISDQVFSINGGTVALKLVDVYNNPEGEWMLKNEVCAYQRLAEGINYVLKMLFDDYDCGFHGFAMQFIQGRHPDLCKEKQAKHIVAQAVQDLHSKGVIHEDIRDENVFVDESRKVWLIDFVLSTVIPKQSSVSLASCLQTL